MPDERPSLSRRGVLAAAPGALLAGGSARDQTASGTRTPADGVVAERGSVQRTIDSVANRDDFARGSYTRVLLRTGTTYEPRRTWAVKRGVVLDFNGAKVVPAGDRDVVHLHPEAHLVRPFVDVRSRDFSATALTLDTRYGKYGGPNRATVERAHLLAAPGDGTAVALHDRNGRGIWDTQFSGMVQGFDTSVRLRANGGRDAFVNSNQFDATLSGYTTAVEHRGASGAAVNGNYFDLVAQPRRDSEHLWDLGGDAAFNTMEADVWDKRFYRDPSQIVRFNGGDNTLVDRFGYTDASHVRGAGHVTSPRDAGVDSRNGDGGGGETGGDGGPANDGRETRLAVEGTGSYTVVVEGSVSVASGVEDGKLFGGDAIEDEAQADATTVAGNVVGGKDVYAITGRIRRQQIRGDVRITVGESPD